MPAIHSHRVGSARFSSESYMRWDCASATLYTLAARSWFWRVIRGDSQARHETFWLGHHRLLKKGELKRQNTSARGYTRASEASVSIYILAIALSRVLSARMYSRHKILIELVTFAKFTGEPEPYKRKKILKFWRKCEKMFKFWRKFKKCLKVLRKFGNNL